jgi:hypothetical protein
VPPDQALRMADALERAGVGHELTIIPDAGHDERVIVPVAQPSFRFLRRELGDVEPGTRGASASGATVVAVSSRRRS